MEFDTDGIFDLRDDFDRKSQGYESAAGGATTTSASDESGSIGVALGKDSGLTVTVGNGWRSAYTADELGGGIVSTVASLATQRLAEWSEEVAESDTKPDPRTRPLPPENANPTARFRDAIEAAGDSADLDQVYIDLVAMLEELNAGLETTMEQIAARSSTAHSGSDAAGHATATVSGTGGLTSLTFDTDWLTNRSSYDISNTANAAIARALAAAATAAPENPLVGTPLERFGSTLDDPDALARMLMRRD